MKSFLNNKPNKNFEIKNILSNFASRKNLLSKKTLSKPLTPKNKLSFNFSQTKLSRDASKKPLAHISIENNLSRQFESNKPVPDSEKDSGALFQSSLGVDPPPNYNSKKKPKAKKRPKKSLKGKLKLKKQEATFARAEKPGKKKPRGVKSRVLQKQKTRKFVPKTIFKTQQIKGKPDKKAKDEPPKGVKARAMATLEDQVNAANFQSVDDSLSSTLKSLNLKERLQRKNERIMRKKNITSPSSKSTSKTGSQRKLFLGQRMRRPQVNNFSPRLFKKIKIESTRDVKPIEIKACEKLDSRPNVVKSKSIKRRKLREENRKILGKMDTHIFREFKETKKILHSFELELARLQMAREDLAARKEQAERKACSTSEAREEIVRLGKILKFLDRVSKLFEKSHENSGRTKVINREKHRIADEKKVLAGQILEKKRQVSQLKLRNENYKMRIQKIFEEHSRVIEGLLADKTSFGISARKLEGNFSRARAERPSPPGPENNFYEDSMSETVSQEEGSFDASFALKTGSSKKKEKLLFNSVDSIGGNIYSPGPGARDANLSSCDSLRKHSIKGGQLPKTLPEDSEFELDCLDNITVECIQSLLRSYRAQVQNLFDFYFFDDYTEDKHRLLISQIEKINDKIFNESKKLLSESRRAQVQSTLSKTKGHILEYKKENRAMKDCFLRLRSLEASLNELYLQESKLDQTLEEGARMRKEIMLEQKQHRAHLEQLKDGACPELEHIHKENGVFQFKLEPNPSWRDIEFFNFEKLQAIVNDLSVNLETLQITRTARKPRDASLDVSLQVLQSQIQARLVGLQNTKDRVLESNLRLASQLTNQNHRISTLDVENYREDFLKISDLRRTENCDLIVQIKDLKSVETSDVFLSRLKKVEAHFDERLAKLFGPKGAFEEAEYLTPTDVENAEPEPEKLPRNNIIDMIAQTSREVSRNFGDKFEFSYIPSNEKNDLLEQNVSSSFDPDRMRELQARRPTNPGEIHDSFDQSAEKSIWGTSSLFCLTNSNGFSLLTKPGSRDPLVGDWRRRLDQFDLELDIEDILKIRPDFFAKANRLFFFESQERTNDLVIRNMISGLPIRANIREGPVQPGTALSSTEDFPDFVSPPANQRRSASATTLPKSRSCSS